VAIDLASQGLSAARDEATLLAAIGTVRLQIPPRIVVAAPHPDDEVLGLGGFLSRCGHFGSVIELVAVTDGEHAYPDADEEAMRQLTETRARERKRALCALGLPETPVYRLAIADGKVAGAEEHLVEHLLDVLRTPSNQSLDVRSTVLVAPWQKDLHPDHEATGRAASTAAAISACQLWEVPIWSWYHLGDLEEELPLTRAAAIALSPTERAAKATALHAFESQLHPPVPYGRVLPEDFLSVFDRDFEIVLT
jgi:LmbE family N-acetylglucosaminyl deacetylase